MILTIAAVFLLIFGIAAYQENNGNFTINLNLYDRRRGLTLSEDAGMTRLSSKLYATPLQQAEPITMDTDQGAQSIDWSIIDAEGSRGANNGEHHIVYTFYLKNVGEQTFNYAVSLDILSKARGVEKATWVAVYRDSIYYGHPSNIRLRTIYALESQTQEDGIERGEYNPDSVYADAKFESERLVFSDRRNAFSPGETHKYTVVIWLEGEDPECKLERSGGMIKLEMNFAVISEVT